MKVGDLIIDKRWIEDPAAIIVAIKDLRTVEPYGVLCGDGILRWFEKKYILDGCEVISESR
mgnify:CR=1 FL=1